MVEIGETNLSLSAMDRASEVESRAHRAEIARGLTFTREQMNKMFSFGFMAYLVDIK